MNQEQIKQLEAELWGAADDLRANSKLTAAEYKDPVLGLILLRYAQNRYEEAKVTVEASIPEGPRGKRAATKEDFLAAGAMMLPEKAQYGYLANLPEGEDINEALNDAMRSIEEDYTDLAGILPKNYQELDAELLRELIRVFNKDSVKKLKGDVFGRIYEYFLMKFSMSGAGAQEGGEFFTPPSLVQLIVNFIEPDHGIIHDPACGSGGMFVQTGHFVEDHSKRSVNEAITVYGTELKSNNTRLAKMNLAIHGIEGKIIESNSFYTDPFDLVGKCDFVMANPPFNVNKVDKKKDYVKTDKRLFEDVGIPKSPIGYLKPIQMNVAKNKSAQLLPLIRSTMKQHCCSKSLLKLVHNARDCRSVIQKLKPQKVARESIISLNQLTVLRLTMLRVMSLHPPQKRTGLW